MHQLKFDDEELSLSAATLAALQEHFSEQLALQQQQQQQQQEAEEGAAAAAAADGANNKQQEEIDIGSNWGLSQFWYEDASADALAKVCIKRAMMSEAPIKRIACVSTPSVFRALQRMQADIPENVEYVVFEYDVRFKEMLELQQQQQQQRNAQSQSNLGSFEFYDFNEPVQLKPELEHAFDVIIFDPPYHNSYCINNYLTTTQFLARQKTTASKTNKEDAKKEKQEHEDNNAASFVFVTGAVLEDDICAWRKDMRIQNWLPKHKEKLGNTFFCYTNFDDFEFLGGPTNDPAALKI